MKPPGADPHPPRSMGQVPHSLGERGPPPPVSSSLLTALGGHGEGWASSMQHHAASELWAPMRAISHSTSPLRGPVASRFPLNSLCSKLKCLGGCDLGLAQHSAIFINTRQFRGQRVSQHQEGSRNWETRAMLSLWAPELQNRTHSPEHPG